MNQSKPSFSAAERSQSTWYGVASAGRAVEVGDLDALAGDRDDLVLAELEGLAGVLDERGHVGGEEVLAVTDAHHERGVAAGGDDPVGVLGVHGDEGERALEAAAHAAACPR